MAFRVVNLPAPRSFSSRRPCGAGAFPMWIFRPQHTALGTRARLYGGAGCLPRAAFLSLCVIWRWERGALMALSTVNPHPIEHSTPPNLQNGTRLRLVRRAVCLCPDVEISHAPCGAMRGGGLGGASTHQPQGDTIREPCGRCRLPSAPPMAPRNTTKRV